MAMVGINGQPVEAQSPLLGVVLCCTSVAPEERIHLANVAKQMGAVHKLDLTSDVTHLIVGNTDTPKYKYVAKERPDVHVVVAEWVEAVRDSWMQGGDTDVAALEAEYRVPTFFGLRVCLTGFEDISQRQTIIQTINSNGATYHGDLSKSVTHLVAVAPQGKKYEFARQWGITVVSFQWITDCLKRGMTLEGQYYDPTLPEERQGQGAWNEVVPEQIQLQKRAREEEAALKAADTGRRKLRRTASAKLGSQNLDIWHDITAGSNKAQVNVDDTFVDGDEHNKAIMQDRNVISLDGSEDKKPIQAPGNQIPSRSLPSHGVFQGRLIFVFGFNAAKTAVLLDHLSSNGAVACISEAELVTCTEEDLASGIIVLPHDVPLNMITGLPAVAQSFIKATDWWAERCLHGKCLISPTGNVLCQPFQSIGIKGFTDLVICSTAFAGIELLQLSKVVKLMGATYDEFLRPSVSVLISNIKTPNVAKLRFAAEHNIPVVTADWLWESIRMGIKLPFGRYSLQSSNVETDAAREARDDAGPKEQSNRPLNTVPSIAALPFQQTSDSDDATPLANGDNRDQRQQRHASNPRPQSFPQGNDETQTTNSLLLFEGKSFGEKDSAIPQHSRANVQDRSQNRQQNSKNVPTERISEKIPRSPANTTNGHALAATENSTTPNDQALNTSVAELFALKNTTDKANKPLPSARNLKDRRRRRGLLGRATSNLSNPSNDSRAGSHEPGRHAAQSMMGGPLSAGPQSPNSRYHDDDDEEGNKGEEEDRLSPKSEAAHPFTNMRDADAPSQALLYENPEVQEQREAMIRKIGGQVEESERAKRMVGGIGVVKDLGVEIDEAADAVGLRVKRRSRQSGVGMGGDSH